MPTNGNSNPVIITIFGIKGDLAMRKLLPALFNLFLDKSMPNQFHKPSPIPFTSPKLGRALRGVLLR